MMTIPLSLPVLVVDDKASMRLIVSTLLGQIGFKDVEAASDGSTALARLAQRQYGLVISDWQMQPMSGYELLSLIRADRALAETRFIMVTAESKIDRVIAAKKAGVDSYLVIPFTASALRSKIEAAFEAEIEVALFPQTGRSASAAAPAKSPDIGGPRKSIEPANPSE
jgi:two-component system chemotaxis response regulator CheY